jgi:rubredoxin
MGYSSNIEKDKEVFGLKGPPQWVATDRDCPECGAKLVDIRLNIEWLTDEKGEEIRLDKCPVCGWGSEPTNKEEILECGD